MKQITCVAMGGPGDCTEKISGNTPEEMVANGMKHVEAVHPDMAAGIKAMTAEQTQKWMDDFNATFAALPDVPETPAA